MEPMQVAVVGPYHLDAVGKSSFGTSDQPVRRLSYRLCKSSCEPGEFAIATDGFGRRSGTYSCYCCADPNHQAPPKMDFKLCPGPAKLPGQSGEKDPKATSSMESSTTWLGLEEKRDIEARGSLDSSMPLCGPAGQGKMARIYNQNYPGAPSILRLTGPVLTVSQQGVCAVSGIAPLKALNSLYRWVAEHVFEKQELRDAVQSMVYGVTLAGNALRAALSTNSAPGFTHPASRKELGRQHQRCLHRVLGRTSDAGANNAFAVNLQVCDADFNLYKGHNVAGVNLVSDTMWKSCTDLEQVGVLTDIADTLKFRGETTVVGSYRAAYDGIVTLWGDFAQVTAAADYRYDWVDAFKQTAGG
ncbi:hypothetical protein EsDP_00007355 [Epichloe bromicola]|uniref:Uncharacterized protein n=1 Tax=Epichloe bromicola TaxID=79588 RepID=A0ABQ0D0A8_9HYPO